MIVRANPSYELIVFDRLPAGARELLQEFHDDPHFYGVLRSNDPALPIKTVDRDTALLFLTMRDAGELPSYATRAHPDLAAKLVFDGVLEMQHDGSFRHGAAAIGGTVRKTARGRIAKLSRNALAYAAAIPITDTARLAARLYAYNTAPMTRRWRDRLQSREDVLQLLGNPARPWQPVKANGYWMSWGRGDAPSTQTSTHKLYISPKLDSLAGNLPMIADALARTPATQFKTGSDAHGLLRPDKLVAYFASFDDLAEAAASMEPALRGVAPQGVPFTAEIGGDGLLSWGADPPRTRGAKLTGSASWRYWLVHRLARALVTARDVDVALERVALDGVDVERWIPSASIWKDA